MYSRLVEEFAMRIGRPIKILTGPIQPVDGVCIMAGEENYPIWMANPFIQEIIDLQKISPESMNRVNKNHEKHCRFGHIISNICSEYGIIPKLIRPSLFLSPDECRNALEILSSLPRPILCLHPYGTCSPLFPHPWYTEEWKKLISQLSSYITILEVGLHGKENKGLASTRIKTKLREMFALVWASDMFVGFDSSIAHVATTFCKPALVLFDPIRKSELSKDAGVGPSDFLRWSYPQNKNLMLLGESNGEIREIIVNWVVSNINSVNSKY